VGESYVRKVRDEALSEGTDTLPERRTTWDELARAREVSEWAREQMPELFAPLRPAPLQPTNGPAHISPEEYERERREADIAAALDRLRKRLRRPEQEEEQRTTAAKWKERIRRAERVDRR
jgi:hypothetical protein